MLIIFFLKYVYKMSPLRHYIIRAPLYRPHHCQMVFESKTMKKFDIITKPLCFKSKSCFFFFLAIVFSISVLLYFRSDVINS